MARSNPDAINALTPFRIFSVTESLQPGYKPCLDTDENSVITDELLVKTITLQWALPARVSLYTICTVCYIKSLRECGI